MRFSFKFFVIAYLVTLLSMNMFGILLIQHIFDEMWQTQYQQVSQSESYTINSFLSYTYYYPNGISEKELNMISSRIKTSLSNDIVRLQIFTTNQFEQVNRGIRKFITLDEKYCLQSICYVADNNHNYEINILSDFTNIKTLQTKTWYTYSLFSICSSLIVGFILYYLSKKLTVPLIQLTNAAKSMSNGHYDQTLHIETNDLEIKELVKSFNKMSIDIKFAMDELALEAKKQKTFVANFSHEMKTPMTTILGYVELLKDYQLNQNEQNQALSSIFSESKRLDKLSQELLSLFAIQNNKIELNCLNLTEIKDKIDSLCRLLSNQNGIKYKINLPSVYVIANETLLLSLLYNLIDNAFKVSNTNGIVTIYGIMKKKSIQIVVQDTGPGINKNHITSLFDPFYRIDKDRSRNKGGNGLGLALCQEIAKVHHTQLEVVSEVGVGTSFFFQLEMVGDFHDN